MRFQHSLSLILEKMGFSRVVAANRLQMLQSEAQWKYHFSLNFHMHTQEILT